jgi:hypothetical protein
VPINPDFPQTFTNLGDILEQTGDLAGAQKAFDEAIRTQPEIAPAIHERLRKSPRGGADGFSRPRSN